MKISRPEPPDVVLFLGLAVFLLLLVVSSGLFRRAAVLRDKMAGCLRLLDSAGGEREQLGRYKAVRDRLASLPPGSFSDSFPAGLLPGTLPGPDSRSFRNLETIDGFQGRRADWSWRALDKRQAFRILRALQSDKNPSWRVAEMEMDASPDGERVSLRLVLETARASDG